MNSNIKSACLLNDIHRTFELSLLQLGNWYGIMSPDIIPVHLVSAFTAESQALESAGGTMAACGHGIMSPDIVPKNYQED